LKDFQPLSDDESGRTMLGLPADDDSLWGADPRIGRRQPPAAPVRDLDAELEEPADPEKDELPPTEPRGVDGPPDDPDPLMDSAFDLGEPLPPVGRRAPDSPLPAASEQNAPTVPRDFPEGTDSTGRNVDITLQLEGVDPELLRVLQSLLGQRFDLRALAVVLKAISIL
jgi:hypothetical protein